MELSSIPYMGLVGLFVLILLGLSKVQKKIEFLSKWGLTSGDKRVILGLIIFIVVFDMLSSFENTCIDYIPKLPYITLFMILLFIVVTVIARKNKEETQE